ncbi:MAG: hypothetical protein JW909_05465 [Planctomycetes bacterium]|nr:hypothetical protein [Planctomycetota bacterium]
MSDLSGWSMRPINEWSAHDPFGRLKPSDVASASPEIAVADGFVHLTVPRGGYASFRLLVSGSGEYRLSPSCRAPLAVDIYRAWYHRMAASGDFLPDALLPLAPGEPLRLPSPDNAVPGQSVQEFWVDIFSPVSARPGTVSARISLETASSRLEMPLSVEISPLSLPERPCIVMDHNSYGCRWIHAYYPELFEKRSGKSFWKRTIAVLHDYYRLIHEHRGHFSNLGFGHSGSSDPVYAPRISGRGRGKRLEDWELFDLHYAPLLDGTAFRKKSPGMPSPRMPAASVWGVYTPITPDWPASYLWWGEKGYEEEFMRCVGQFDEHLRSLGPSSSTVWFFFNHKKRYRWFEWDGDEPKYAADDAYHLEMGRLLRRTVKDSPVKWLYRMDASWQMKNEFEKLAGSTDFWVCGGFVRWYPQEVRSVLQRGDTVWWYGGCPSIDKPSSGILENVYKTWARGLHGFCSWLTTSPGPDPWFDCDGAATGVVYPGARFGIQGPLPSIRLKIQRNGIQDVDLVNQAAAASSSLDDARRRLIDSVGIAVWESPPSAVLRLPPEDWDNHNLSTDIEPGTLPLSPASPDWWQTVRRAAFAREIP